MTPTKIEWADYTWNVVTGCKTGCEDCYARRLAEGRLKGRFGYPRDNPFKPTFHPDRLDGPSKIKKPSRIFVCSMGELWGPWVQKEWISAVLEQVELNERHTFIFLTKWPEGMTNHAFPVNMWCGISANNQFSYNHRIGHMSRVASNVVFLSAEPLHAPIMIDEMDSLNWIIIGAETGNRKDRIEPESEWIESLTKQADDFNIPVFHKDNLAPYYEGELRREFPTP